MKILGIGVDIINNKRIKSSIKSNNFLTRTFGKKELLLSKKVSNKSNYFAKRFAAKESLVKSFGTGFRDNLNLKDIEILNDKLGKPNYTINSKIKNFIQKKKKIKRFNLFLSISDEREYSIAFTIIQKMHD